MPKSFLDYNGLVTYNTQIQGYMDDLIEDLVEDTISSVSPSSGNVPTSSAVSNFVNGKLPTETTVTIATNDWSNNSCTKNVTGVTASNTIIVSPAPASLSVAAEKGVYATGQGNGTITFSCGTVPSSTITMNIVIMK